MPKHEYKVQRYLSGLLEYEIVEQCNKGWNVYYKQVHLLYHRKYVKKNKCLVTQIL